MSTGELAFKQLGRDLIVVDLLDGLQASNTA